jgi:hypothetical protein
MLPSSHSVRCDVCKAHLLLSAIRDLESRTKTAFTVSCPACYNDVRGEIPLSIMVASVRIISFERAPKRTRLRVSA